ncbi:MAG TPA: acyl-CoA dehydrogenase family protein [Anaeromyxobacteraceae bacterium]|nr:acyl-CoA dehydrogenase family protein [Anaeromyxobacteraceae bacterium]
MAVAAAAAAAETLRTLPGDDVRHVMWRMSDRYDLQMLVQSVRQVARGPVARLVAEGARNSHEWTEQKNAMLEHYDACGATGVFMEPHQGGFIEGPKNLAMALVAFELAWVDAGAATGALAGHLALSPIHERGTQEQQDRYMSLSAPPAPGEDRKPWRGAFALTEPIPYVGVDTGMLGGKVSVARWEPGQEPVLKVEKRGRFITNMGFANFVTAAVDSADERIKGSCMVILEEGDPGTFDRGTPTKKLVHQLSSTNDPIFALEVPASRIVGGYTVKDGVVVPRWSHDEIIAAVFKHTRVPVGVMTAAKLLSAVEPVIRYQRGRFRGAQQARPGSPRYELGLQVREDVLHRLVDVWATGEAGASLGFATARLFDELDPLEKVKFQILQEKGITGRAELRLFKEVNGRAVELVKQRARPEAERDAARVAELEADPLVRYAILDSAGAVLCPATKLWNTGHGATVMREAVSLMGGYGITEDCPGFLGHKWMDAQLEATYEGPEAVQRRQLSVCMQNEVFLAQLDAWTKELRHIASERPETGACNLASAFVLWRYSYDHLQIATDAAGEKLYQGPRQGVTFALSDALAWLMAARSLVLDVVELEQKGAENAVLAEGLSGLVRFYQDLAHVQCARASGEVGRICAELVYGYNKHPAWDNEARQACWDARELDELEDLIPGIASCAKDVIEAGGGHPDKAGPCAQCSSVADFAALRMKLDQCLTGARLAKDRAAEALSKVMIPEALDYPV